MPKTHAKNKLLITTMLMPGGFASPCSKEELRNYGMWHGISLAAVRDSIDNMVSFRSCLSSPMAGQQSSHCSAYSGYTHAAGKAFADMLIAAGWQMHWTRLPGYISRQYLYMLCLDHVHCQLYPSTSEPVRQKNANANTVHTFTAAAAGRAASQALLLGLLWSHRSKVSALWRASSVRA